MRILIVAPYASTGFRVKHRDINTPGLGGSAKLGLIVRTLLQGNNTVRLLSSVSLSNSRLAFRKAEDERIDCRENSAVVHYPSSIMARPLGGILNCFRAAFLTKKIVNEYQPQVALYYNTYLFETISARQLKRQSSIPIVLQVEDLPLARKRGRFNIKPKSDQAGWNWMLSNASAFVAVNKYIFDKFPDDRPRLLLPGIINPVLIECAASRKIPFSGNDRKLGYFGGLSSDKGIEVLERLVPRLSPPWKLIVAGTGQRADALRRLEQQYPDRLSFPGQLDGIELYRTMCDCDCVIVPPERICSGGLGVFPFKVFEYLACGAHIVSIPLPSLGDLDLSFLGQWNGQLETLEHELVSAEQHYNNNSVMHQKAVEQVKTNYSIDGVDAKYRKLIGDLFKHGGDRS